jgi:hypothetical protein
MIWLKDYRLAGFVVSRGFPIADMRMDARNDVEIGFADDGKVTAALREHPGSTEHRYDTACKAVHDLIKLKLRNR